MPVATKAATLLIIAYRVNVGALTELIDKVLYSLYYDVGRLRLDLGLRVAHNVKIV